MASTQTSNQAPNKVTSDVASEFTLFDDKESVYSTADTVVPGNSNAAKRSLVDRLRHPRSSPSTSQGKPKSKKNTKAEPEVDWEARVCALTLAR